MNTSSNDTTALAAGVRAAEEARRLAMLAGDTVKLASLFSDALVYVHSTGVKDSKQSYLQLLSGGTLRYETLEFLALEVKLLGSVGVVTAIMKANVLRGEVRRQVASSYLAVWENTASGWQLQMVQATPLPAAV